MNKEKHREIMEDKELTQIFYESWSGKIKEYIEIPLMFTTKKTLNKKWRWWKLLTNKYNYKFIINPEWKKYHKNKYGHK